MTSQSARGSRGRAVREIVIYGLCSGSLITILKLAEYRFLVVERSIEIYGALIAALFAGLGIWLGLTLTPRMSAVLVKEVSVPTASPFMSLLCAHI